MWCEYYFSQTGLWIINSLWNSGRGRGGGQDKPPWTACPPTPCQYITQLNIWSKHLRLTEIKFISLSTNYSCSGWCNKICWLSILFEILGGGQDKPPWTACPPPLVNTQTNWTFEVSISVRFMSLSTKYSCSRWCNKICGLSILSEILGGGQDKPPWTACPPHPLSIRNPTERLK